jgi:choline dehydrogenase-like flavoprotein
VEVFFCLILIIVTAAIYEISPEIEAPDDFRASSTLLASAMESYTKSASGILTAIPSSVSYLPLASIVPSSSSDLISFLVPHSPDVLDSYATMRHKLLVKQFEPGSRLGQVEYNFDTSNYSPFFTSEPGKKYATMLQMLQYPFSTGSIHIPPRSDSKTKTTINETPIIDPKYYQCQGGEVDFQIMVAAQAFGHKITTTSPLSLIIVKRVFPPLPENGKNEEQDLSDYVRNHTITDWHPVGTCSMGPPPDRKQSGGVVDARLRVHGVKSLRVVDASIMPLHVSAHIQATVYAIAEKGASMILEDYERA